MSGAAAAGGSIIGASLGLLSDLWTNGTNYAIAKYNAGMQEKTNLRNEGLMREGWARDDFARQRMVKDLEKAGLSKWLASGATPMSSAPISLNAPQLDYKADFNHSADAFSHIYENYQNMVRTEEETNNIRETGKVIKNQVDESAARARIAMHDADVFEKRADTASTDPAYLKYLAEAINLIRGRSENGSDLLNGFGSITGKIEQYKAKQEIKKEKRELKKDEVYRERTGGRERRKPLSMTDWATQTQTKLGSQEAAKLYKKYVENYYKYAK